MSTDALRLDRLTLGLRGVILLREVSLAIGRGRMLALVGESGSGKTLTGRAAMGALTRHGPQVVSGRVWVGGVDLANRSERDLARMRGLVMSTVQQEPASSLDPCFGIGWQLREAIELHRAPVTRRNLVERLEAVGIEGAGARLGDPPHLWSGGQLQRVMTAIGLANDPDLLVADEPTTALDATLQRHVLDLIDAARTRRDMGVLLVTHDLGMVAERADEVAVMYAGAVVEQGPAARVLGRPRHPYTASLLACRPLLTGPRRRLAAIGGQMPPPGRLPRGCAFRPRCDRADRRCEDPPPLTDGVACFHPLDRSAPAAPRDPASALPPDPAPDFGAVTGAGAPVLRLDGVWKVHADGTEAVRDVSLSLAAGQTLGIVGESGSGKSTLGRMMLHLIAPTRGEVAVEGVALGTLSARALRRRRRRMQMVFQNPRHSLDPRLEIGAQILQPMVVHRIGDRAGRIARVRRLLDLVGLPRDAAGFLPYRFSGGQLQRVAIARALATDPVLLVADEPVASLDLSIQAQILDLFASIRREFGLATVFISHDLAVVRHVSDRVAVMRAGGIVEAGVTDSVLGAPRHAHTRSLLSSVSWARPSWGAVAEEERSGFHPEPHQDPGGPGPAI